jgi:hypothetical protein
MMDSDKGTWIKNAALKKWLSPHLGSGGVVGTKKGAEQSVIIKNYFNGVAKLWPKAWGNLKEYNLVRPIGFEIMLGIFAAVKHRCDLNCGKQYTADNFHSQLSPLRNAVIDFPAGGKLHLDWQRGLMGTLSNAPSRTLIMRQLQDLLRKADED